MLVAERYERIVRLVNERGSIRVNELSELCGVTEETIRRDLTRLELEGKLRRSHGGAVSVKTAAEIPHAQREIMNMDEKRQIAQYAVQYIAPRERIILDASSTAWYMAALIPDIPLTVLTNSMKVAQELSVKEKIEVIAVGGLLSPASLSFVGPLAERSLEPYFVDKAFVSCKGLHLDKGISESNEAQARVKQKMIEQAGQVILLADSSKIGVQAFTKVSDWEAIHRLVTDRNAPGGFVSGLRELGVDVVQIDG